MGQHPPGAAGAGEVTDGVDDLSHRVSAGSPGSAGGGVFQREEVIDVIPLQVREVAGVSHPCFHDDRVHEHSGRREGRFLDGLLFSFHLTTDNMLSVGFVWLGNRTGMSLMHIGSEVSPKPIIPTIAFGDEVTIHWR